MAFERFARNARVAVMLAQEEARELCDREIGSAALASRYSAASSRGPLVGIDGLWPDRRGDAGQVGPKHPLVISRSTRTPTHSALSASIYGRFATAWPALFGADAFDNALSRSGRRRRRRGHISFSRDAKKVLELALREALAHKDDEIRCEHLLLGILGSGDRAAIALITEHVYTAQLRAAVVKLLEKAA